jgi:hypothetical protein
VKAFLRKGKGFFYNRRVFFINLPRRLEAAAADYKMKGASLWTTGRKS